MKNRIIFICILLGLTQCLQAQENVSWLLEPQFEEADFFSCGTARVKVKDKWGYIDKEGEMMLKPQYGLAGNFCVDGYINPLADVQKGKRGGWRGSIHKSGYPFSKTYPPGNFFNSILCALFEVNTASYPSLSIYPLDGVIFYHQESAGWGILRPDQEKQIQLLENNENYTILRPNLNPLPEDFDHNPSTIDIMAIYGLGSKKENDLLPFAKIPLTHCKPDSLTEEELLPFMAVDGEFGYMNPQKEIIIEAQFEEVQPFFENIALVKLEGKYGYLKQPENPKPIDAIQNTTSPLPSPSSVKPVED